MLNETDVVVVLVVMVMLAEADPPGPDSVEVTAPVVLFFTPTVVPVTFTEKVQLLLAGIVPPVSDTLPDPATAVMVPLPQLPDNPFGVATTNPAGRLSVNATPVSPSPLFGLLMVKLSDVVAFNGIVDTPNVLLIVGADATVMLADAVLPVPPLVEVTLPVVLVKLPDAVPVMLTDTVQLLFTATVPPLRLTLPEPATAVAAPAQVLVKPFGVATTIPAGKMSVTATPVKATVLAAGLVMVNVRLVVPFSGIVLAPNALAIDGGATTLIVAVATLPVPPSVDVTLLVVLFCVPAVIPVTLTENVQLELAGIDPPLRLIDVPPAAAVIVPPPQLPDRPFGVETTRPPGRLSVNPTPVRVVAVLLF